MNAICEGTRRNSLEIPLSLISLFFVNLSLSLSLVSDSKFIDDVEVADHDLELLEGDLSIEIGICLDNSAVDQLLQLCVVQVGANHHFEHLEQFTI